jgi:hypothetical protein
LPAALANNTTNSTPTGNFCPVNELPALDPVLFSRDPFPPREDGNVLHQSGMTRTQIVFRLPDGLAEGPAQLE